MEYGMEHHIIKEAGICYKKNKYLSDEILQALDFTFPGVSLQALELLEKNVVKCLKAESGRYIYKVLGSTGIPYMCTEEYCSCPAFKFSVLKKAECIWCKHLLAIKLTKAMGIMEENTVSATEQEICERFEKLE